MKKILFFTSIHNIGLTAHLTEQACTIKGKIGENVLCIAGENEQYPGLFEKLQANEVPLKTIKGLDKHSCFFKHVNKLKQYIDIHGADIVNVQSNWQLSMIIAVKYLYNKKFSIIYTVHGYRHNFKYRSIFARYLIGALLYVFADKVIQPSSFLLKKFSFLKEKNKLLFLGEDDDYFIDYIPLSFKGKLLFLFPGQFREGKNQDLLIRVFKNFITKTDNKNCELILPGTGETLQYCKDLATKLNIEKKVLFPGFLNRSEMLSLYKKCHFAIIPTNIETFGHCIVEPFIFGRIVITRRVGVAEDIIFHNKTGFLFETEEDLLKILLEIHQNIETCHKISKKTYDQKDMFKWDYICNKYLEIINS